MWRKTAHRLAISNIVLCLIIAVMACMMSGCSTLSRPEEVAWQTLNAVDMFATADLMKDPCVREGHPLTRQIIGDKPSTKEIVLYGAASSFFHLFVSDMLIDTGHETAYKWWQGLTFINTGYAVGKNISIGWKIGGPNKTGCSGSSSIIAGDGRELTPRNPSAPTAK